MPIQVRLLAKTALAEGTLERLLLIVDVAHVTLQVTRDAEAALAVLAFVGLFTRVGPQVPRKISGPGEYLTAEFARVTVLRLETRVYCYRVGW